MRMFFCILLFTVGAKVQAETAVPKNAKFIIPGVGQIVIRHDVVGEPIGQPERVEVFVTCAKTKKNFRAAVFRMCIFEGHNYEPGTKSLTLNMYYGRVEPKTGDVICDQHDIKNMELADICAPGKR